MQTPPSDSRLDSSLTLLRKGHPFGIRRCPTLNSNVAQARLLLPRTIGMRGEDAARVFNDERRLSRRGTMPRTLKKTRLGVDGVRDLDDVEHGMRCTVPDPDVQWDLARMPAVTGSRFVIESVRPDAD